MNKLGRPLDGELWITQNYHANSSNRAVDISAAQDRPVYALADGDMTTATPTGNSYCVQSIDGSDIRAFYVHTYKWLPVGTHVKKGQVICYIAPKTLNGGFPTHLHLGTDLNHNLMDYMDRSIVFRTGYSDIRADWFNGADLNWNLFKDLEYKTTPPEALEIEKLRNDINILNGQLTKITADYTASQAALKESVDLLGTSNKLLKEEQKKNTRLSEELEAKKIDLELAVDKLNKMKKRRFEWVVNVLDKLFPRK